MRTKARLTITLDSDLIQKIDTLVDGQTVKNRSHAIETLVAQSLAPAVHTAVILAGGKHSGKQHAAFKKLGDTYLIIHTLNMLKKHHITRVILCVDAQDTALTKLLGNGESIGLKIEYSTEKKPLGTGGAVKQASTYIKNQPFLVIHGDVLTSLNFSEIVDFHFKENSLATIAVKPSLGEPRYGQVFMQGNKITRFLESSAGSGISIINAGVYVFDPKAFDLFPAKESFALEKEVFPLLANQNQLSAFIFQGTWFDISSETNYQAAQERWRTVAT